MSLTLDEYDQTVKHHLTIIAHCAESIVVHVGALRVRPNFEHAVEDELARAIIALAHAQDQISFALAAYRRKPADA
jgi:hypothetical protein